MNKPTILIASLSLLVGIAVPATAQEATPAASSEQQAPVTVEVEL